MVVSLDVIMVPPVAAIRGRRTRLRTEEGDFRRGHPQVRLAAVETALRVLDPAERSSLGARHAHVLELAACG